MSVPPVGRGNAGRDARGLLVLVLGLAALLRLVALDTPLYIDEITTLTVASQPLSRMGEVMRLIDASPALFPLLLHVWLAAGRSDVWVRLLPALLGLASVYVAYRVGRQAYGPRAGLLAALVVAIAPAHVHYAQYVRNYSLLTLVAGVQMLLFLRWFDQPRHSAAEIAAFGVSTAALVYSHYLGLLLLVPEGVVAAWHLVRDRRRAALECGAAVVLAALLFAPGIPLLSHNVAFDRARNLDRPLPPPLPRLAIDLAGELSVGQRALGFSNPTIRRATLGAAAVLFPALLAVGVAAGWRRHRAATITLLLVVVLPAAVFILSGRRLVAVRFFLPFTLASAAIIGLGLAALGARWRAVAVAALVVVSAVPLAHYYTRFQWGYDHRTVARELERRRQPGDVLLFVHPFEPFFFRWYLGDEVPMRGLLFTALEDQADYVIKPPPLGFFRAVATIRQAVPGHDRFWVIGQSERSFTSRSADQAPLLDWLDATFERVADLDYLTGGDPAIRLYRPRADVPSR